MFLLHQRLKKTSRESSKNGIKMSLTTYSKTKEKWKENYRK